MKHPCRPTEAIPRVADAQSHQTIAWKVEGPGGFDGSGDYSRGGSLPSLRCRLRRWIPSFRAACEMFPPQSARMR